MKDVMLDKEKGPAVQGRKALTIPKRSDGMPDYNAVTEFARLNSITTTIRWKLF